MEQAFQEIDTNTMPSRQTFFFQTPPIPTRLEKKYLQHCCSSTCTIPSRQDLIPTKITTVVCTVSGPVKQTCIRPPKKQQSHHQNVCHRKLPYHRHTEIFPDTKSQPIPSRQDKVHTGYCHPSRSGVLVFFFARSNHPVPFRSCLFLLARNPKSVLSRPVMP